ncbi:50S ribosomal protein L25-like [Salvia splendens]|uniref:50S ribosomal protein L25-like n=1 Tax=Salvia splendens TaxID=180675 RepID=UPI001C273D97|nr:50S ribosomal protein L25-like [Salvia splendens]
MSKCWRAAAGVLRNANQTPAHRSYHTIQAVPRELSGHRISARERAQGRIPAVVFSQKYVQKNPSDPTSFVASTSVSQKLLLTTERKQIKSILKDIELPFFCSTAFPLQIRAGSGSSTILQNGKVLPIKIHRDDEGNILNLVFAWAEDGSELKVEVPIVYTGEDACPGVKKGGTLVKIRKSLKYMCPSEHIPQKIEVDVSNLDIEDRVSIHDPVVHPSLKLLSKNESIPICKVKATYIDIESTEDA